MTKRDTVDAYCERFWSAFLPASSFKKISFREQIERFTLGLLTLYRDPRSLLRTKVSFYSGVDESCEEGFCHSLWQSDLLHRLGHDTARRTDFWVLEYHMEDANIDMLPSLRQLLMEGLRILIFSGDQDSVIPLLSTRTLVRQLAGELRLHTSVP
ncbi:hypothetical protein L7F22_009777 [Adiantum nelumboides]|nr:hypothetical protein [Adiantum nelumboides]